MRLRHSARSALLAVSLLSVGVPEGTAAGIPDVPSQVPPAARARIQPVTEHPSLAVKVAGAPFVARREVFEFLLDHPDFATHVTRALKLARYKIWRTPGGLGIDDGWGTVGTFETVWASTGLRVMYARGAYQHRILPDIQGQAVVVVDYGTEPMTGGRSQINTAISGYVKLDNRMLSVASRLASAVARAKGEKEARKLAELFAETTHAIEADPAGVFEKVRHRPDVPVAELEDFRRLLNLPRAAH